MSSAIRPITTALLALTLAAGCTAPPPGPFPPRPYTITVESVDPCAALTTDQRSQRNLVGGRPDLSQGGTSRGCGWIDRAGRRLGIQTFPVPATAAIGPEAQIITIAGFGAVRSSPAEAGELTSFCQAVIDVADNASLRTQLEIDDYALDPPDDAVACRELEPITAQMLDTLRP